MSIQSIRPCGEIYACSKRGGFGADYGGLRVPLKKFESSDGENRKWKPSCVNVKVNDFLQEDYCLTKQLTLLSNDDVVVLSSNAAEGSTRSDGNQKLNDVEALILESCRQFPAS